jgi:hypothetical protein
LASNDVGHFAGLRKEAALSLLVKSRLLQAFQLTRDLIGHLDEPALGLNLPGLPSNTIGEQLWCLVGARESYMKAMVAGQWQGFSCSLTSPRVKTAVLAALDATRQAFERQIAADLSEEQLPFALALLEHEVQHHGQLIRFVYGNRLTFPPSWKERYTV